MPVLERILVAGITGSGKTWQWLKLAQALKSTGSKFRCINTDLAVTYMLDTEFPELKPENGGNVYVHPVFTWPEYKRAMKWVKQYGLTPEDFEQLDAAEPLMQAYNTPVSPKDWVILDTADDAWSTVQRHFISNVFDEDMGDYFLRVRKLVRERGDVDAKGKPVKSIMPEAMEGWVDWPVVNRLYDDWMLPIVYQVPCHVYAATRVEPLSREERNPEILQLYGNLKVKPTGNKKLGGQLHTIFLFYPGEDKWQITTVKDRANRSYFKRATLTSLYKQYLVAKAGWELI